MVISNLNIKQLEDRLTFINQAVARLKQLGAMERNAFLQDDFPAITESYLRRALEAVFDIARHILAKTAEKGVVEYKETARLLGKQGIIPLELSERLHLMAGYRNRLVHFYGEVTDQELYDIIRDHLKDFEDFIKAMVHFLKNYQSSRDLR